MINLQNPSLKLPPPPPPTMFCRDNLPSSSTVFSTAASIAAATVILRNIATDLIPDRVQTYFSSSLTNLSKRFSSQLIIVIEDSDGLASNHLFEAANVFLGTKLSPTTQRIKVKKPEKDDEFSITVDKNQEMIDFFDGVKLKWVLQTEPIKQSGKVGVKSNPKSEFRFFELSFNGKYKEIVMRNYLPYIIKKAKEIKEEKRTVKLHTVDYNGTDYWSSVVLNHPANFQSMAMEVEKKRELMEDLNRFISRKDYYRRVGKAWKRGYLFYGPPGTGKSSLVAAMANHLKFDVYDLDLREVQCNSDLRRLLIGTKNRSILVIEDIDCNVGVQNREAESQSVEEDKITLSGLLNFIDGLWSSCGDERIIVFTTNHKDHLDPALLRPGRMDVHLEMSYCTYSGFKILASNYLQVEDHKLFEDIERLLKIVDATPAEVAGELMKSDNVEFALEGVIHLLQIKKCMS